MSEHPQNATKIQPVADDELQDAAGGQMGLGVGGSVATSGPENDVGQTACFDAPSCKE